MFPVSFCPSLSLSVCLSLSVSVLILFHWLSQFVILSLCLHIWLSVGMNINTAGTASRSEGWYSCFSQISTLAALFWALCCTFLEGMLQREPFQRKDA